MQSISENARGFYVIVELLYLLLYWLAARLKIRSTQIPPTASQHKHMTRTNCCIYRVVPPDDEQ